MNRIFKYIFASALLIASLSGVANAQMSDAEKAKAQKSIEVDKWTTPGPVEGSYYLNLETFVTGYTSNVTTVTTTTTSTPLDIVLLLDVSGSMEYGMNTTSAVSKPNRRIDALQTAVGNFITTIKKDAVDNNVDHRISLIKFASPYLPDGTYTTLPATITGGTVVCQSNQATTSTKLLDQTKTYYIVHNNAVVEVRFRGNANGGGTTRWRYQDGTNWTRVDEHNPVTPVYSVAPTVVPSTTQMNVVEGNDNVPSGTPNIEGHTHVGRNATQIVKDFRSVKTAETELKNAVNALYPNGATAADYGMTLANFVLQPERQGGVRPESLKIFILFTDGDPTYWTEFSTTVANSVISSTKTLKDSGVKVYVVSTIQSVKDGTDTDKYLKYASSDYPEAISLTSAGSAIKEPKFSINTNSASELDKVFQRISEDSKQEAANSNAGYTEATTENNVTVKDIVTSNFVLPADAKGDMDLSKIEIYTAKSTGVTRVDNFDYQNYAYKENGYTWAKPELSTLEPAAVKDADTGKTTVSVPGFNFSEYWVGWQDDYLNGSRVDDNCSLHDGYKLIIKILVEPNPNSIGGEVPTNDPASGLYITKNGVEENLEAYPQPDKVLVPMDLNIVMNGIKDRGDKNLYKPGETAIFKITDYAGKSWTVAVTANESGVGTASIKVPFYNDATKDTYKVEEMPEWSYRFNSKADPTIVGNPANSTSISKQLTVENHTFYFVATDTDPLTDGAGNEILDEDGKNSVVSRDFQKFFYDESSKNNVFNSSANPTGTSTTSRKN